MTRIEQLERMVEVLRVGLRVIRQSSADCFLTASAALNTADRIAAEPVELTDAEVVERWLAEDRIRELVLTNGDDEEKGARSLSAAAAWVRAQGGGK